jgi:hypothetical protein
MTKSVSAKVVNEAIGKIVNKVYVRAKLIVDGQGIVHQFPTPHDFKTFLEERDLELVGKKS